MQAKNTEPNTQIEFSQVSKLFQSGKEKVLALDNVSLSIFRNEFFTLLGPSGCGKTTMLRILAGFEYPDSGALLLDGQDLLSLPPNKRLLNMVFQSYALFSHMTVGDNIAFGVRMLGKSKETDIKAVVEKMLHLVRLGGMTRRKPAELSGGQQQRIALARALAPRPKVLLLDEPLSALDSKLRKEMQIEMKGIQRESNTTFVSVTHNQEEALTMSDRIAVLNRGRIRQVGSPKDIYYRPSSKFVAGFIGEMNFINARAIGQSQGTTHKFAMEEGGCELWAPTDHGVAVPKGPVTLPFRPESCFFRSEKHDDLENAI